MLNICQKCTCCSFPVHRSHASIPLITKHIDSKRHSLKCYAAVASFSLYKMHSFHKTWNLFPLNLHSLPLHGCLPSLRSSTNLVPDVLAQGGGHLSFLVRKELTWLWSQSHSSSEASQLSGHQLCDPAISSVCLLYFVFLFFSLSQHADESRCDEGGLSISACRVKRVDAVY